MIIFSATSASILNRKNKRDAGMHSKVFGFLPNQQLLFAAGVILLAVHPVVWLVRSWFEPAYGSYGSVIFALVLVLFLWSVTSPRYRPPISRQRAVVLFAVTAAVRATGQVLAVNVIGAVALVLDVYALGLLFGLEQRRRALSPGWLAVLFAFALPLERIAQRTIGYILQQVSAGAACGVLGLAPDPVQCEGVRILLAGRDVVVDLPCSGAQGLLLLLLLFAALAALARPTLLGASLGLGVTLVSAVAANVVRITALALGLAYPEQWGGIAVMAAPWHELIGFLALALGATPVLLWARTAYTGHTADARTSVIVTRSRLYRQGAGTRLGLAFLLVAAVIVSLPSRPIDVARPSASPALPASIAGLAAIPSTLTDLERHYFSRYGGGAVRAQYGPFGLLVVRTSAPLRHLHAPDECLAGAGHRVRYVGMTRTGVPTAVYRSVDPHGGRWRVSVTYVSERGEIATSVAEAVWRWLQEPGTPWTMVQRVVPWDTPASQAGEWEAAALRALDLPQPDSPLAPRGTRTNPSSPSVQI